MIEIACPGCGAEWELEGKERKNASFTCEECKQVFSIPAVLDQQRENDVLSLTKRYQDAYFVANATGTLGVAIKVMGTILGVLVFGLVFFVASLTRQTAAAAMVGLLTAFVVGGLCYLLGVLLSAVGQVEKAVLDTAVNPSPFLGNSDRANIMSLRRSPPPEVNDGEQLL